jgi:hypothetical protein
VPKTVYTANGELTFGVTDSCEDGSATNTVPVNPSAVKEEPVAISSIGEFRDVVRKSESVDVFGRSTGLTVN